MTRRRVAVLMGGRSSEHPISLASAQSVIAALDPERYEVVAVEIGRDGRWTVGSGQGQVSAAAAAQIGLSRPVAASPMPTTL